MAGTTLGTVTEAERDDIRTIFMRKQALTELSVTLADRGFVSNEMYERVVQDLGITIQRMQEWWAGVATKYAWKFDPSDSWGVDFDSRVVTLQPNAKKGN